MRAKVASAASLYIEDILQHCCRIPKFAFVPVTVGSDSATWLMEGLIVLSICLKDHHCMRTFIA